MTKWSYRSFSFNYISLFFYPFLFILVLTPKVKASDSDIFSPDLAQNSTQLTASNPPQKSPNQSEPNSELPSSKPATPAGLPERMRVRKITVIGSTVFSQAELNQVVQRFEGRDMTREETIQVADAVTQLYLEKHYINSRAIPETQQPNTTDSVLVIRVIEGSLAEIEIQGTRRLNPSYIRNRIQLGASIPINTNKLEEQLKLLRVDPLFQNVEASLRPTGRVGQSILIVRVIEANPLTSSFSVDNYSPPSVGSERLGISLSDRNLTGMGDQLAASYYRSTTGGSDVFDFSYQVPVNPMNGTIQIRTAPNRNNITQPPFNKLGIRGSQDLYEINYRQPLVRSSKEEFALSLGFTYQDGQTFSFDQLPTPFGIGPDKNGVSRTSVIKFSQDYVKRNPQGAWFLRSQFNLGTGLFNATTNHSPIPDGHFFSWLGQLQRVQQLSNDHLLLVEADLQLTPDSLLPSEQFIIGGGQSLRGYRQNARYGDNGFRLAIEDRIAVQHNESGTSTIELVPFLDLGSVWNQSDNPNKQPHQTLLASAGLGLIWKQALGIPHLNLRLDYGIPLINLSDRGNNLQDNGFYFSLNYQSRSQP